MQAIVKTLDSIQLQEKTLPIINDDNGVVIKVTLAGLCRTDSYAAQNKIAVATGMTLGHEFTGVIYQIGAQVKGFDVGQRVGIMPIFITDEGASMLGVHQDGAFAEYVRVPATHIYPVPEHLSDQEIAFLEPIAACLSVVNTGIQPHQRGFIYGKNRIAELTCRILKIKGFDTVDVFAEDETIINKNAYDFGIETTPTETTFEKMLQLIKRKGLLILKSRPHASIALPLAQIVAKEITLVGAYYANFQEGIELLASGALVVQDLFSSHCLSLAEAVPLLLGEKPYPSDTKIFIQSS